MTRKREDETITAADAAREKGVHRQSVYQAVRSGKLKATRSGKIYLIRRADLAAWEVVRHRPKKQQP